ncbi:tetratricopeptide repeat protein [Nannocystis bainbridge]|uniref:Tetratricopeptide repeat protein n=1 Tax=Nannocystis bainbridge TaxID=2995303 RepID=A0ABT5DX44_9BACT|nr:tetratricopeptide repeat protein [Nannocystis bainbridge]MDC0717748.1 tetratricopeptide repeat protein [Nannocystis bainbridge]
MSMQLLVSALVSVAMVAPASSATKPTAEGSAAASAPTTGEDAKLKRAEELFLNGRQLFKEGSYEAAILAFQESYELSRLPEILYNIGNSYEKLGDFANARKYLDQYRAFAPEKERELLGRRIQNLDQRLREQEDRARAERERQEQEAKQAEPGPVAPPPVTPAEPAPEPKKDRVFGPAAGVLTGVAVVGLGLGIGFGVSAQSQRNQALEHCSAAGEQTYCDVDARPFLDAQKSRALGADISFAIAGAAAIAVIAIVAVKATRKKREQTARLTPWGSPRGAGLALGFRF